MLSRKRRLAESASANDGPNTLVEIALFLHSLGAVETKARALVVYTQALMLAPLNLHAVWGLAIFLFVFGAEDQQGKFRELIRLGHKSDHGLANLDFLKNFCFLGGAAVQSECPEALCSLAALISLIDAESEDVAALLSRAYVLAEAREKGRGRGVSLQRSERGMPNRIAKENSHRIDIHAPATALRREAKREARARTRAMPSQTRS